MEYTLDKRPMNRSHEPEPVHRIGGMRRSRRSRRPKHTKKDAPTLEEAKVQSKKKLDEELAKQDGSMETRDEAMAKLAREASAYNLRAALQRAAANRGKKATKSTKKKYKERMDQRDTMTLEELEAEGRRMTTGGRMKEIAEKKKLVQEILLKYVKQFTQWAWHSMRFLFVRNVDGVEKPVGDAVYRMRFVCPSDKYLKQGYLESMIVIINGNVYGFQTDNHRGVEDGFAKKGSVRCSHINRLEVIGDSTPLPDDKAHELESIDFSRMIFHRPTWWGMEHIHAQLVLNNILTEERYHELYPTLEDRKALMLEAQDERERIQEKMHEWDEEAKEKEEKMEAITAFKARFGKPPPLGVDPRKALAKAEAEEEARASAKRMLDAIPSGGTRTEF